MQLRVDKIWWREVTPGDYYNVEKPLTGGPTGQQHFDVPNPSALLTFLGLDPLLPSDEWRGMTIPAGTVGDPDRIAPITFRPRPSNNRFDIPLQNTNNPRNERHPAWSVARGWPLRSGGITDKAQAPEITGQGLHLYVVRTTDERYIAGFTTGRQLPPGWPEQTRPLFEGRSAGVIEASIGGSQEELSPLTSQILAAFRRRKNVLVYGPPGTGKTHAVAQAFRLAQQENGIAALSIDPTAAATPFSIDSGEFPLPQPVSTDWVTFHQDYGYEDFIIGLRPVDDGSLALEPQAGRLLDAAIRVDAGSASSALLVVDEINRGNVPKILGDFLTFMDEDYRVGVDGSVDRAIPVNLPKLRIDGGETEEIRLASGGRGRLPAPWYFPREVYLLATMNSVDRAVAPLDTAMGRRFVRIDAPPDVDVLAAHLDVEMSDLLSARPATAGGGLDAGSAPSDDRLFDEGDELETDTDEPTGAGEESAAATDRSADPATWTPQETACLLLLRLNDEIAERLGPDFELGHLYFWNVSGWADLQSVWDHDIWPQLRDRFGARPDQLAEILKIDSGDRPTNYPFRRRGGRSAVAVSALSPLPPEQAAQTLKFLARG